jgi:hypothetical protein
MAKKEPTLGEFMTFIKKQFGLQQQLLEKTAEDIRDLRQGQMSHDRRLDEVEQAMRGVLRAVDRDAVKVVDHERRIHRLEFRAK